MADDNYDNDNNMSGGGNNDDSDGYIVRVRGLPWSATSKEVSIFFADCNVKADDVHMTLSREGRPSGEAYMELFSDEDLKKAMDKHNEHMGHRYIEVFKSKRSEMDWVIKRSSLQQDEALSEGCVRLRGLPFGCTKDEIIEFFTGLEIVQNGISLPTDYQGRSTGEAYVQFASKDMAEMALGKHKEKIGHRYIEIFKSSLSEIRGGGGNGGRPSRGGMGGGGGGGFGSSRPGPYDRGDRFGGGGPGPMNRFSMGRGPRGFRGGGFYDDDFSDFDGWGRGGSRRPFGGMSGAGSGGGGGSGGMGGRFGSGGGGGGGGLGGGSNSGSGFRSGHCVHMRGLPFRASEQDIQEFFRPLQPVGINILYEDGGRAKGECDVEFATHEDAVKAMAKDKAHMQHRYIELFLNSTPDSAGYGGGPGGNMNSGGGGSMGYGGGMGSGMGGMGNGYNGGYGDRYGGGMGGSGMNSGGFFGSNMGGGMSGMGGGGGSGMMGGSNYNSF